VFCPGSVFTLWALPWVAVSGSFLALIFVNRRGWRAWKRGEELIDILDPPTTGLSRRRLLMLEVQLVTQPLPKIIVTFHANTMEFFYATAQNGGQSFHVDHIKSIGLIEKIGKTYLVLLTEHATKTEEVSAGVLPKARELVAAVQPVLQSGKR
jgi:hypothetical protein